jgi:beta-xylosidase
MLQKYEQIFTWNGIRLFLGEKSVLYSSDRTTRMPYRNPVYPHDFPDPFVMKHRDKFWGYCTGFQPDGGVFGIIHSKNLTHWEYIGSAMQPLAGNHPCYWAPEVTQEPDGSFLLYYSVGNEETMHIRIARSERPEGPFHDLGVTLTKEPFAIDPHVFIDDDSSRYLFYATDFLTHTHIGTGTVVDRMIDSFTLEGKPEPVTRAKYEWQVYDPKRASKGGVKWHTVEGPFVLKHNGLYYQMFSGGNWQNLTYGVSYAVSDKIKPGHEWHQHADGMQVLPVLRTIPGKVIGPGHNSVVIGPDGKQLFCVYHLWQNSVRAMAIDRIEWEGNTLTVHGPTTTEQPSPDEA